jgi:ribosome-associated protein
VLDLRQLSPVTDFFVIATGTSPRQMRTVANDIEELAAAMDLAPISRAGYDGQTWIITDFVDVIVHIFSDTARRFYDLDNLWGDAKRLAEKGDAIHFGEKDITAIASPPDQ